ncbi:MBL fold metallo-hydrolase [Hyphobacterium sp. HN65]|uniref:MBL fold metallo-hydrolase n=1 Tax=Hyphobacterium lacteum TaxID=3116575 RepID=A0ABU7LN66_9PROT|nr:MBL fold metallo-hydrolase [Hyphobacterium sp. HN65]MEE2525327.1 MBL fold metallo-hydrolase [Hyphobacterium sp. HN65]
MYKFIPALVLTGVCASAAFADPFEYRHETVAEGIHLIYRVDPVRLPVEANIVVIEQSGGLVVVDSGGSAMAGERIIAQIREISDAPVRYLVNTHWHGDHHLGNAAFLAAWPDAEIIAQENTITHIGGEAMDYIHGAAEQLEGARPVVEAVAETGALPDGTEVPAGLAEYYTLLAGDLDVLIAANSAVEIVAPSRGYADILVLEDSERPVELHYFGRGNTDGDTVIWLPEQRVVATGDLVVNPTPFGFGSYPADWIETLGEINALDYAYLIPGHGAVQTDTIYVDQLIALIAEVRSQVAPLADAGMSLEEVRAAIDLSDQQALFANGNDWIANRFNAWWVQPFVGVAYQEATGDPIIQGQ